MTIARARLLANITNPGLAPKLTGSTADFLDGTGVFSVPPTSGGGSSPWPAFTAPPAAAGFTGTNVGSSTLTDSVDALHFRSPGNASADSIRVYSLSAPATPYTLTAAVMPNFGIVSTAYFGGILLRESGTGKIVTLNLESSASLNPFGIDVMEWTNATTFSARQASILRQPASLIWLRIINIGGGGGTALTYEYSYDGQNWETLTQTSLTDFFTTAPDEIGIGGYSFVTGPVGLTVVSWDT